MNTSLPLLNVLTQVCYVRIHQNTNKEESQPLQKHRYSSIYGRMKVDAEFTHQFTRQGRCTKLLSCEVVIGVERAPNFVRKNR